MEPVPRDRAAVEAAIVSLQECLADGDPSDTVLRQQCEDILTTLRTAYRANPSSFSREAIEALRELSALLREAAAQ